MLLTATETEALRFTAPSLDETRQASEKALNLWVGASLPLWAPFFAAASAGIGAWAMVRTWQRGEAFVREMPLSAGWLKSDLLPEGVADMAAEAPVVAAAEVAETVAETTAPVADAVTEATAPVVETAAEAIEPVLEPVTETPVVPAVAEAVAEPVVPEVAPAVEPKTLAQDLAVAKTRAPKKKA